MKAQFTAVCTKASLAEIRKFMEQQLVRMGIGEPIVYQLVLAVDEACANSIIHQHHDDGVSVIEIRVELKDHRLVIELEDEGEPFPIDQVTPEADIESIVKSRAKGGLGLILITRIMDKVEVIRGGKHFTYRFIKKV
jgi:serine/threonine-protein kinase RsbW